MLSIQRKLWATIVPSVVVQSTGQPHGVGDRVCFSELGVSIGVSLQFCLETLQGAWTLFKHCFKLCISRTSLHTCSCNLWIDHQSRCNCESQSCLMNQTQQSPPRATESSFHHDSPKPSTTYCPVGLQLNGSILQLFLIETLLTSWVGNITDTKASVSISVSWVWLSSTMVVAVQ